MLHQKKKKKFGRQLKNQEKSQMQILFMMMIAVYWQQHNIVCLSVNIVWVTNS